MERDDSQKRDYRKTAFILSLVFALSVIVIIVVCVYAVYSNKQEHSFSFDWSIDSVTNEDVYAIVTSGTPWENGEMVGNEYSVSVVNNTKYSIRDWSVSIIVPEEVKIESYWNGTWTQEDGRLIFSPGDLYGEVIKRSERAFGIVLYSKNECEFNEITFTYKKYLSPGGYLLFWIFLAIAVLSLMTSMVFVEANRQFVRYANTHTAYKSLVEESLKTIANIIDTKDEYTRGHSVRVAIYSRMIAKKMGLSTYDQERIYYIGLLHDIGKVGIPSSILTKPGRLTEDEFEIIKRHPRMGASIMKDFHSIDGVVAGVRYHHEKYDGSGYNEGLKGEEIPMEGRIICVADSYDAMSSRRCYRNSLSYDFILNELKNNAGKQFDPEIVQCMVELVEGGYAPVSEAEMEYMEVKD